MKGIILAGNSGSKLFPLTNVLPKQLLPVYDKPMIYYPIMTLANAGIKDILIITTSEQQALFKKQLGDGHLFSVKFSYACQDTPNGMAEALKIARDFIDDSGVCLVTGDTVLIDSKISLYIEQASKAIAKSGSATIFVYDENDDAQYGKVVKDKEGKNKSIVGTSDDYLYSSIVGMYVYPSNAVDYVKEIEPSERGRLEITTLNQMYLSKNKLQVIPLDKDCVWLDTNSFDTLLSSSLYIKTNAVNKNHGSKNN